MKKQINEQQLRALTSRLNERTSNVDEGVWDDMKAGYQKYAPAWAGGTPAKPAGAQATKPPAKPAAPAGAPKVAYDKTMPAATVQELQTKLNAKDPTLKLTVDGKLGPATKAAMAKYPDVTTDPNAPQNQAAAPAAPAAAPAPSPEQLAAAQTANGVDPATGQNVSITNPDGSTTNPETGVVTPAAAPAAPPAADPTQPANPMAGAQATKPAPAPAAAPQTSMSTDDEAGAQAFDPTWGGTKAAPDTRTTAQKILPNFLGGQSAPVAANKNATWNNAQQAAVSNKPATAESVGFQNDELNRIISLVHHR
jgi:hypothetical protein